MAEWLSYETQIDAAVGVVDIDVALDDPVLRETHPQAIQLSVRGFAAGPDGLPTDSADDALYALEQRLEALLEERDGVLAVTLANAGSYRCVAYAGDAAVESALASLVTAAGFTCDSSAGADPQWRIYANWALSGEALEQARDRAQVEELENIGDDLTIEREIDFDFEFDDANQADRAARALEDAGYDVTERDSDDDEDTLVQIRLVAAATADDLRDTRARMSAIVAPFGAKFVGWGCEAATSNG